MSRLTRIRFIPALTVAIASLAAFPASTLAQQPANDGTVSFSFPGGTAAEFIEALRKADPSANIVVLGALDDIRMHDVQLKAVDVLSALSVLNELPQEQGDIIAKVRVNDVRSNQDVPAVYTVTADVRRRGAMPGMQQTTVISMADLLNDNLKAEDALRSIEVALTMLENETHLAKIQFHQETGLLIARGDPEQIESIRQVITQLRERESSLQVRAQSAAQAGAARDAAAKAAILTEENAGMARTIAEWRTKAELLEGTLDNLRRSMANLEEELRVERARRESAERKLSEATGKP